MKAIVVNQAGGVEVLELQEIEKPKVKEGWSLVKVKGFGINRSEIFTRQGLSPSVKFPRVLGIECVGVIEETTDSGRLPIGQTVVSLMGEMGRDFDGSYAEYVLLPNSQIYPIETNLDWKTLATIPETYYTAYLALQNLQIKEDDSVLVRGASSGVGIAFAKLLKAKYPTVKLVATTRQSNKSSILEEYGFDQVILEKDGLLQTKDKYNKILELVGPATVVNSLEHLLEYGIVCSCGQLGRKWFLENFDPIMNLYSNKYLSTAYSGDVSEKKVQDLFSYIEENQVDVKPENIFELETVWKAHKLMESDKSFGKNIVLLGE